MKKVITVTDLCCERCANRLANGLLLQDGVLKAKANYKKNCIFVEVESALEDEWLTKLVEVEGFTVVSVAERKGLFG